MRDAMDLRLNGKKVGFILNGFVSDTLGSSIGTVGPLGTVRDSINRRLFDIDASGEIKYWGSSSQSSHLLRHLPQSGGIRYLGR